MDLNEKKCTSNLPAQWIWSKLDKITDIIFGQSPPSATYNDKAIGLPFFQGKTEFGDFYPEIKKWCSIPKKIAEEGDILISVRAPVGPTNICPMRSCIGRGLAAIRPPKKIKSEYILYLIRTFERKLARRATGTTFKAISGNQLRSFTIPFAPIEEQKEVVKRIEGLFDKLDAGLEELEKVKKQIKRYRQAVLKAAFTGELTKEWREKVLNDELRVLSEEQKELEKYKIDDPELPELPEGWIWIKIGTCADIIMGQSPPGTSYNTEGKGTPLINGPVEFGPTPFSKTIKSKFTTKPKKMCKENDLILCVRGSTTGRMNIAGFDACIGRGVAAIKSRFSQKYLNNFIHYKEKDILKIGTGSTFPNISSKQISEIYIPLTSTKEQNKIVEEIKKRFERADEVEKIVEESLKKAKQLRQSILREAFKGNLTKKWREEHPELITGENSAQALLDKIKKEREKNI